jgi:D-erythrulose 1-phosphate 3-epimerase
MKINLGLHLGFASTRFYEPKIWTDIVRNEFNLDYVQFVSDLIEPSLPKKIIKNEIKKIKFYTKKHKIYIKHAMTLPRYNYIGHSNPYISNYWKNWLKDFIKISSELGVEGAGSLLGIYSFDDLENNFQKIRKRVIDGWVDVSKYAKTCGIKYLIWEPMSVKREMGETIRATKSLHNELNRKSHIPILLNLDVDHGDIKSKNKDDYNPYKIIKSLGKYSPAIHLKQKTKDIYSHKPFIKKYNKIGLIKPDKIINELSKTGIKEVTLYFEFSFREREPFDSSSIKDIKESVKYWRKYLDN